MNEKSKSRAEFLQLPHCERVYDIEGVGEVTFPPGVNMVEQNLAVSIDLGDVQPEEIQSIVAATNLAKQAIDETYDPQTAKKIKQAFSTSLNYTGGNKLNLSFPFKIIVSEDFFGIKFSVLPDFSKFKFTYDVEKFFTDKLSAIEFLKKHPVNPLGEQVRQIRVDTAKSSEELRNMLKQLPIAPEAQEKFDKATSPSEIILVARELGIALEETFSATDELEEIIKNEEFSVTEDPTLYECAETETSIADFRAEEVNTVSTQCCEPQEDDQEETQIPDIEEPLLQSEEEILDFIDKVNAASDQMKKCSEEKAYADQYVEKLYQVREDLYPVTLYMLKRGEFLNKYEQIISTRALLKKNVEESTKVLEKIKSVAKSYDLIGSNTGSNVSIGNSAVIESTKLKQTFDDVKSSDAWQFKGSAGKPIEALNAAYGLLTNPKTGGTNSPYKKAIVSSAEEYGKLNDTMNSLSTAINDLEKSLQFNPTYSDAEKLALQLSLTTTAIDFFKPNNLLLPTIGSNYSNQGGINPSNKKQFFVLVDGEKKMFDEIKTLFELNNLSSAFKVLYRPSSAGSIPGTKDLEGRIYNEVWKKYNSTDRVDFLFTAAEQGYLSPKPTVEELQDSSKQKIVENVKIDEAKAAQFLSTYDVQQEIRLLQKIAETRASYASYFANLERAALEDASRIYEGEIYSIQWNRSDLTKDFKDLKAKYLNDYKTVKSFDDEMDKKIKSLKAFADSKKECFAQQEQFLASLFPQPVQPQPIESPCSDPFGAKPPKVTNPGPQKNCYWKEYTKNLQTVSFMPIPDVMALNKRLFRYYPVGLQIPVPAPPGVLPTLALGIPDPKISIPFPILWKHILTLTTPAGQFVLWITYCPPFTVAPYLLFFDENLETAFLSSAKGKVAVPAPSLKWKKFLEKSLAERIPGLKIPMKALPSVDSNVNNKKPDSSKTYIEDLKKKIKAQIDKLDSSENNLSAERIEKRTKLKKLRDSLNKAFELNSPEIPKILTDFVSEVKGQVTDTAVKMIDFEPITVPKTNEKKIGSDIANDISSMKEKIAALKKAGAKIDISTVNVGEIIKREALGVLDTASGKKIIADMDREIIQLEARNRGLNLSVDVIKQERAKIIIKNLKKVIDDAVKKIDPKKLGWVEDPITLIPAVLPFPCRSNIAIEPIPPWMFLVIAGIASLSSLLNSTAVEQQFEKSFSLRINLANRLPRSKDIMTQAISSGLDIVLQLAGNSIPVPGWPTAVPYPKAVSPLKQIIKDAKNSVFKVKLRMPPLPPGIPPVKITPQMVSGVAKPIINAAVDLTFAIILEELLSYADSKSEQLDPQTINKIQKTLALMKAVLGTDIWDIREQDIKAAATAYAKNAVTSAETAIKGVMAIADAAPTKEIKSIFSKLTGKLEIKIKPGEPSIDIGQEIAFALFKAFIMGYVTGKKPAIPYPVVLLGCSTGIPGWMVSTLVNPLSAVEKTPPWERLCLKNVPHVIFLDMIAASAQRYGGIGNSYLVPYFTPEP